MDIIWILLIIGTLIGLALATFFGAYNEYAVNLLSRSYFGIKSDDLVFYLVILVAVPVVCVLITLSIIVRDLHYPITMPGNFLIETLMMAILPSIGILMMPLLRGYTYTRETIFQFLLAVFRFGVAHILFQFSGFWSDLFPPLKNKIE